MVVTVYSGPGTSAYQSSQYTVTVNGSSAYVYGHSRTAPSWDTQGWSAGESPYQSWVTWAADETVTVVVTRLAGAITSCTVYPTEDGITKSIVGSTVTLTVPANRRLQVEINGSKKDWLWLFSSPPITIPGGTTSWATYGPRAVSAVSDAGNTLTVPSGHGLVANERVRYHTTGTYPTAVGGDLTEADFYYVTNPLATTIQLARTSGGAAIDITSAGSGTMQVYRTTAPAAPIYFPAGDWRIGRLFDLQNGYPVYLDGSAHVTGTYDLRGCTAGSHIIGHGVIKANLSTWEVVVGLLTFEEQLQWSACYGSDGATFERNNRLEGVTIVCPPFYTLGGYEFADVRNVQILSGWTPNADGFDLAFRSSSDITASVTDCLAWCGDDSIKLLDYYLDLTVDGVYCVQSASSAILVDYFGSPRVEFKTRVCRNIYARSLQLEITDSDPAYPTNSLIKAWVDSSDSAKGAFYLEVDGFTVVGELLQPLMSAEVRPYPWAAAGSEKGQVAFFDIRNVTASGSFPKSRILGSSWQDTPHDIALSGWRIGGVNVTGANFADFFEVNAYPYNITVEGQTVVTAVELCNRALAYVGESPFVVSISPPDDTKAAKLCQKFWPHVLEEVTQGHEWGWATKRIELTEVEDGGNDFWRYCYEEPAGMMRAIEMLPKGAPDGFRDQSGNRVQFRREVDADGVPRLWSNLPEAWLRYSVYVTDPNLLDPWAQDACVMLLASKLAGAIMQGREGQQAMAQFGQMAMASIARAKANDGNQRILTPTEGGSVPWLAGRVS
jgi:hypothetical protein